MSMERVTTFSNGTKVVQTFHNAKEAAEGYMPKVKRVYLPDSSPLKAAGVDSFQLQVRKSGNKLLSMLDKDGKFLTKTGLTSEVREIIKAIRRFGLKF